MQNIKLQHACDVFTPSGPPENPPMPATVTKVKQNTATAKVGKQHFCFLKEKKNNLRHYVLLQPTAELDRSGDQVYTGVMAIVKQVVQMKNDVNTMPASEYPSCVKVGTA